MDLPASLNNLAPIMGTILSIRPQDRSCNSQMISLNTDNGPVNFILTFQTLVLNHTRLRPGMRIVAYYDTSLPVPLIFPPQYQAQIISVLRPGEQTYLGYFNRNLTAMDQALRLNLARSTIVETINGQSFSCSPGNRILFVYYSNTTRSIPPQTTPRKIIVMF